MRKIFSMAACAVFVGIALCACNGSSKEKKVTPKAFPYVAPPRMVLDQAQALQFMAQNYWNLFADSVLVFPQDTSLFGGMEQKTFMDAVFNYSDLLSKIPVQKALIAQRAMVEKISGIQFSDSGKVVKTLVAGLYHFLYDPNSPVRNEELMIPLLEMAIASPYYSDVEKIKFEMDLKDCGMNRIGEVAADFRYTDVKGRTSSMHKIKADRLLVFFSNPGCNACMDIIKALTQVPEAKALVDSGRLKVLNMYIDEDLAAWREYLPVYPDKWISAYDPDMAVKNTPLYNIRAIPSMYLLDKDKRVILKDATLEVLFRELL